MGAAPSRETLELLLPQAPFYGQRQQVVLVPLISHFFPDADCPLFRQLYDTRCDPSVRYYQCVKEIFTDDVQKPGGASGGESDATLVMECEEPECFPGTYFTRTELYDAYIRNGPERFLFDTDAAMLSAYQADPLNAVRPVPCAVAFLYHLPPRPPQSATTAAVDASGAQGGESPEAAAEAAAAATALVEPWLSEGCVEVLGCYVKITGFIGDVNMLNPNFTPSAKPDKAAATATTTSAMASLAALEADDDEARESTSCMELHMYLTKSAGDHNRTHVLLSAMYTYAEQWQRACLHYAAIQEEQEKTAAASAAAAEATPEPEGTVDAAVGVVPAHVRAHTTTVGSTAVFDVTRNYSSASSSYYRKFLESKSATVMRSLLSATEAARESQKRQAPDSPDDVTDAERDDAQPKVISHLSGTKRQRAAPETAFLLWAAPPLPAARLHSRRTNVPLLCFLREVRAAFMSMHVCAENLRALQEIGDDSPLSDNIAVAPATLTCNCVEYEAALDDLIMWLEMLPTQAPRRPVGSDAPTTTTAEATDKASSGHDDAAQVAKPTREETYLTVYAPSWVVQRLLEHVVDCLLHNLSPLEILKAQRELQHQHNIDPPPPEPMPGTKNTAAVSTEANVAATTPPPPRTVCNCAMLKRMGKKCIHNGGDGPPCCCCSQNVDGTISRVPCRCSVNHSIGLETKQLRLPDEDIIVEEWPPRLPHSAAEASTASTSSAQKPDLRQLQTHRADHRLLYLVGEEPAGRQSATQCIVDWLAQGHSLTVGSSNANVAELEITVTLPHAEAAEEGDDGAGAAANEADPSNEKVTTGHCDCGDCDCEAGVAVTAQGFTIHQLPRMAPLAPFLSTVHHPHPAVWSRRTLEIFRQAAADHERAARERAAREGGEQRLEPAPLLLLRPGTVIELGRAVQGDAATAGGGGEAGPYREVRISCFPTEELLLAELRFASRKGREGHPDDPHWVRYGPGEGPPPSVPQDQSDGTARRAGRNEEDDEEDDDAIPPRPPGGENIVGDGSSCLWRMDLGDVADRILAVTPYFLKPTRKKHVKKKKAIPKAAAAHGTALNVFFYPLPPEETTTTTTPTSAGAAGEATAVVGAAEAGTATTAASAKTANGNKKKDDSSTAATAVSGAEVDADGPEAVTYDADGNPIPASEKAKKKKKKKNKKKANVADADGGEESGAGGEADDTDGVPAATQPTPASAEVPEAPLKSEPADEAESTKADGASTAPAATVDAVPPAEPSTQTPSALLSSVTPLPRERQLNSDAPPFQSRQSSIVPEGSTGESTPARQAGPTTTTTTTAAATSSVPLPRSRNAAAPAAPTTTTVPVSSGNRRPDALHTNWGYPYSEGVGMMDPNYYGPDGGMMMNPPLPPPPPGFMGGAAAAAAAGGAGYYYGMGMAPGMLPPPPPMPMGNAMMPPPGPYGFDGPPPPPDAYYGGYNPNGLPPPPPPHLAGPGGPGPYYPPSGPDGYGGYYNGGAGFGAGPGPQAAAAPARTIVPPVPRTRRQVSFGPTGEPIATTTTTTTSGSSSVQPSLEAPNRVSSDVAAEVTAVASDRDAPPLLSHYNPAPMPSGLPPTSPTSRTGGLISPTIATLLPETHSVGSGLAGHGSGTVPGSELHVSVKVRHHHHHRTMSYMSESTTDAGAGSGVLHFSASHADMTEDSPHGTNHSLPVQSPVSATHRRQVSFSHLTTASSEPAGGAGIGSAHHSGVYAPVHHHHAHHSLTSNPAARPAGAGSSGHTGTGASAGGLAGATATGVSGQAGLGIGSIKSGDTTSTTNTAKRMQASSNTYRWDWRSVTLDIGEEDQ